MGSFLYGELSLFSVNMEKSFDERCYELIRNIPEGKVVTYKQIAHSLGSKGHRAVGNAMAKNKDIKRNPCYKVVKSDGGLGSYQLGVNKKKRLLERDGIEVSEDKKVDLKKYLHRF